MSITDIMPVFAAKLSYSTIKTVMSNLAEKGHLRKRAAGRANEFRAAITRAAFEEGMLDDLVRPLIAHYRNPLLAHIVSQLNDDDGIAELERLLELKRGKRPRD
ncbi:MAG: BlaI/MecI/CopY family transcriptional regulator [Candidatus Eremiobacteraeota bacterium]|nr:BlaI/MecI/CopY family transcriptional regulator [Candidatus Eremiobacteraeota bacterium]